MFGSLGFPELLFILVLALLIFGPKRLPEIGRTIGKGLAEFRRASSDLKRSIDTEILAADAERPASPRPAAAPAPAPAADGSSRGGDALAAPAGSEARSPDEAPAGR